MQMLIEEQHRQCSSFCRAAATSTSTLHMSLCVLTKHRKPCKQLAGYRITDKENTRQVCVYTKFDISAPVLYVTCIMLIL